MNAPMLAGLAAFVALLAVAAVPLAQPARAESRSLADHVILLDWDGLDPAFLETGATPHLDALVARGSLSVATSTWKTISNSARASLVTGAYPEVHANASYYYDLEQDRAQGQSRALEAETLAQALGRQGRLVAAVQWYMVQDYGTAFGDALHLYAQPGGRCVERVRAAVEILRGRPVDSGGQQVQMPRIPDLLAIYCDDLDALVHRDGPASPAIGPLVTELDALLGEIVEAAKAAGIYERTAFVVVGDHGMSPWRATLLPDLLDVLRSAGFRPEVVPTGRRARPESDVLIVNATSLVDLTLRGAAATEEGRARVAEALRSLPHARVLDRQAARVLHSADRVGDFVLEAEPPWSFAPAADGREHGFHGSSAELEVPLVLSGAGFAPGRPPVAPRLIDVAPTVAALLGADPPAQAQGRVLEEALAREAP